MRRNRTFAIGVRLLGQPKAYPNILPMEYEFVLSHAPRQQL